MPLYEYECETCKARFEVIQKFSDPRVAVCRTCGGQVHRMMSAPAIQFKGSGWYITDYARKGQTDPTVSHSNGKPADSASNSNGSSGDKASADKSSGEKSTPAASTTESKPAASSATTGDSKPAGDKK